MKSLSFKQLNRYLQNLGHELITYDLLSLMYDEDPRLQTLITSLSPEEIQIGKKTDDSQLAQQTQQQPVNTGNQ